MMVSNLCLNIYIIKVDERPTDRLTSPSGTGEEGQDTVTDRLRRLLVSSQFPTRCVVS